MEVNQVPLKDRIYADLKDAMKQHNELVVNTLRLARAAIKNKEIELRHELSDDEVVAVLTSETKKRKDAIEEYQKASLADRVAREEAEMAVLARYMPAQLTEEELRAAAQEAIAEVGAKGPSDVGKVMRVVMPRVAGRADGRLVSETVKALLSG